MLHYETVEPQTLELLKELMEISFFSDLILVGGTSLSLQIGHRKSIDLDLFGKVITESIEISEQLRHYKEVELIKKTPNIFIYLVNGIKVDFVNYHYPWLEDYETIDGIRLASKKDIAAMKISAITGRGSRKDFVDLYFLLKYFTLKEIMDYYDRKYFDSNRFLALRSLTYFNDADSDDEIVMINSTPWNVMKDTIVKAAKLL